MNHGTGWVNRHEERAAWSLSEGLVAFGSRPDLGQAPLDSGHCFAHPPTLRMKRATVVAGYSSKSTVVG